MIEVTNDTYGYEVLPPRKLKHSRKNHKSNTNQHIEDNENTIDKEDVNSRIVKKQKQKQKQYSNPIIVNVLFISFILILFSFYCLEFLI